MPSDTRNPRHAGATPFYAAFEDETARVPGKPAAAAKLSILGRLIASVTSLGDAPQIVIEPLPAPRDSRALPNRPGDGQGGFPGPADVRYCLTPPAQRAQGGEDPAAVLADDQPAAEATSLPVPAAVEEVPTWKKPYSLPPNVRFTRTPDRALRSRPAGPDVSTPPAAEATGVSVARPVEFSPADSPSPIPLSYLPDEAFWHAFANVAGIAEATATGGTLGTGALAPLPAPASEADDASAAPVDEIETPVTTGRKRSAGRDLPKARPGETLRERRRIVIHLPDADAGQEDSEDLHSAASPDDLSPPEAEDEIEGAKENLEDEDGPPWADPPAPQQRSRRVIDRRHPREERQIASPAPSILLDPDYEMPPLELLAEPEQQSDTFISPEALESNARLLEGVLDDFGVRGEIIHVRPGPVVTLYELEPAPGIKSSRVIGLADDIARSMSALSARVAVVPGRNVIGIELPNAKRETVYFRELIGSQDFEASKFKLALCLGKTIGGEPVIAELAKMPHLLVAGTTGSGKSVAINTMILSLLYRLKPEECRLIMVDPKMLELSVYDGIPHLLGARRHRPEEGGDGAQMGGARDGGALQEDVEARRAQHRRLQPRAAEAKAAGEVVLRTVQTGFDRDTGEAVYEQEEMDLAPLPYIVVIVDEMADLMMVAGKDIEGAIQRLAQMARAAGIHLIMATQRPSVDVITGTIKANFPTRISFQVTSKIDSRTILGEQGAEQLLGQGDMLHMAGGGRIARVHGPFVSDDEVEKVVAHLKAQGRPDYLDAVTAGEDGEEGAAEDGEGDDGAVFDKGAVSGALAGEDGADLYDQAVKVVLRDKKCSTSYIQRRLQIGYNRAASLVERMEKEGLVGPANHAGKREIIANPQARPGGRGRVRLRRRGGVSNHQGPPFHLSTQRSYFEAANAA